jgi:D-glycero-D-manno-heptose 1,7-bisphosphate phosphatase
VKMHRVIVFDADGTLRRTTVRDQPCPHAESEWELIDGVVERLAELPHVTSFGVASNQDHVGYGLVSETTARDCLVRMIERATGRRVPSAAIRLCPHRLEEPCMCRKPEAGMLTAILGYYEARPDEVLFVGDSWVDREAATRAGVDFEWADSFFRRGPAA